MPAAAIALAAMWARRRRSGTREAYNSAVNWRLSDGNDCCATRRDRPARVGCPAVDGGVSLARGGRRALLALQARKRLGENTVHRSIDDLQLARERDDDLGHFSLFGFPLNRMPLDQARRRHLHTDRWR